MEASSPLKIKENDVLWRFYYKRFSLDGKQVEEPKNHCRYFWTAVKGFGFWLTREISLKKLWGIFLLTNFIIIGAGFITPENFVKSHQHFLDAFVFSLAIAFMASFLIAILATFYRIGNFVKRKPILKKTLTTIMVGGFTAVVIAVIVVEILRGEKSFADYFWEKVGLILKILPFTIGGGALMILITLLVAKFHKRNNKAVRLVKSFTIFLSDTKKKFCRTVEPPPSFQEKQDN